MAQRITHQLGLIVPLLLLLISCHRVVSRSPGNECRENLTRGHLTRCDKYFQCVVLPSKRIIWVSKQCAEGLVYDKDQGLCVVPDVNWECDLGDEDVATTTEYDPDTTVNRLKSSNEEENVLNQDYFTRSEESGSGGEEEEIDEDESNTLKYHGDSSSEKTDEFSGDGTEAYPSTFGYSSTEAASVEMPITPDQDGTLKSYLQRLTQLIDGFRKRGGSTVTDITPDQLNSFVVMHKIKSNKNYDPSGTLQLPENGKILKPHLDYILQKQFSLNSVDDPPTTTTTTTTPRSPVHRRIIHIIRPYHRPEPEENSNIVVKFQLGSGNGTGGESGSNSQIVVNRPEGSVLFNLARPVAEMVPQVASPVTPPSISQDTLKSVLELSKQLVSHQKYLAQKPNYFTPMVQPVYYAVPLPMLQGKSNSTESQYQIPPAQKPPMNLNYNNFMNFGNRYEEDLSNQPKPFGSSSGKYPSYHQMQSMYQGQYQDQFHQPPNGPNYYHNDQENLYQPVRPPYYDASGFGGHNFHKRPSQFSYDHDHLEDDSYDSYDGGEDTLEDEESYEKPLKTKVELVTEAPTTTTTTTTTTTMSPLQLLGQQLLLEGAGNRNKIIGINGNYMSYDKYKDTILPILNTNAAGQSNLEVVACSAGVRHSNSSDCTRYYVCNPKNGDLLGYTCPPFTAFNENSRICDAGSYAMCRPGMITSRYSIEENKRLQFEAQKALQEAKRIREQILQDQIIRMTQQSQLSDLPVAGDETEEEEVGMKPIRKIIQKLKGKRRPPNRPAAVLSDETNRPGLLAGGIKRRRRYKCTDPGQLIPDVNSVQKYFVCFRDPTGQFKRRAMSCSKKLVFCAARKMCTLRNRC